MIAMADNVEVKPRLNPIVKQIGEMAWSGNVMPMNWFQHSLLRTEAGKPNLPAIILLADIVYWYRPLEIRDEVSGRLIERKQKFQADRLQKSYQSWGEQFGLHKRQVKDAVLFLERRGLIRREVRARVQTADGRLLGNVVFVEPIPERLRELEQPENTLFTSNRVAAQAPPSDEKTSEPPLTEKRHSPSDGKTPDGGKTSQLRRKNVIATAEKRHSYDEKTSDITEITTETTTEINSSAGTPAVPEAEGEGNPKPEPDNYDPGVWKAAEGIFKLKWQAKNGAEYSMGRPEAVACNAILTRLGAKKDSPKALSRFSMVVDAYLEDPREFYAGHPILRLKSDLDRFIVIVAKKLAGKETSTAQPTNGVRRGSDYERDAVARKFGRAQAQTVNLNEVGSGAA